MDVSHDKHASSMTMEDPKMLPTGPTSVQKWDHEVEEDTEEVNTQQRIVICLIYRDNNHWRLEFLHV